MKSGQWRSRGRTPRHITGDPADLTGFPRLVDEFCEWMGTHGYSVHTIEERRAQLGRLVDWLAERGVTRPVEVTRPMLESYQRWLFHYRKADGRPLGFRSQNQRMTAVRLFFRWAARARHLLINPASEIELPRAEHRLPRPALTVGEAERVLAQPDLAAPAGLRDRAMLELLYATGVRRSELANLAVVDVDVERCTLFVRLGKGSKDRMLPLGERALVWVQRYLTEARPALVADPDDGKLFISADGVGFGPNRVSFLVARYVKTSGVGKVGACHLFRHTCATLMLEGGADIRYIQAMLGHAELSTTQVYAQVSIRALQAVHAATHPGATNTRHRSRGPDDPGDVEAVGDNPVEPEGDPVVQLFALLDQEITEENRAHPDPKPARRPATG